MVELTEKKFKFPKKYDFEKIFNQDFGIIKEEIDLDFTSKNSQKNEQLESALRMAIDETGSLYRKISVPSVSKSAIRGEKPAKDRKCSLVG